MSKSDELRAAARAFRFYGASAEATECEELAASFEGLEAENAKLREALEFYATGDARAYLMDGGKRARAAAAAIDSI